jgi:hypothetical protein
MIVSLGKTWEVEHRSFPSANTRCGTQDYYGMHFVQSIRRFGALVINE